MIELFRGDDKVSLRVRGFAYVAIPSFLLYLICFLVFWGSEKWDRHVAGVYFPSGIGFSFLYLFCLYPTPQAVFYAPRDDRKGRVSSSLIWTPRRTIQECTPAVIPEIFYWESMFLLFLWFLKPWTPDRNIQGWQTWGDRLGVTPHPSFPKFLIGHPCFCFFFSSFPGDYKGGGALFIVNSLSPSHLNIVNSLSPSHLKSEGKKKIKRENKISSMVAHSVISF